MIKILLALLSAASLGAHTQSAIPNEDISTVHFEPVSYPLAGRLQRIQGTVVVRLTLDERGSVTAAAALSGAKALVADCVASAKKWRFKPNSVNAAIVVFYFKIEGLCQLPCASQFRFEPPNLAVISIGTPVADHAAR